MRFTAPMVALLVVGVGGCSQAGDVPVRIDRSAFSQGDTRFWLRGVSYSVAPGNACLYARDLPLIAAMGANTVRTYGLLPEGDKVFSSLLDSTRLHWLAGFPLDSYYDPSQSIGALKARILEDFRAYAWRFRGQRRLIAYIFGQDVARDYSRKFAGAAEEFYQLIGEAAAVLKETEPQSPPLLTTAVSAAQETQRTVPGLSFWSLDGYANDITASLPVLISAYSGTTEMETAKLTAAIEGSPLLGEVYAGYLDQPGWRGVFSAIATEQAGLDTLRPRAVFYTLAGLWGGSYPAAWDETRRPHLAILDDGTAEERPTSPGALVRLSGKALLNPSPPYTDDRWPLYLATSCLCVGAAPARMRMLSPDEISAQVPATLEPGEHTAVFFRAGVASNFLHIDVRQFAAGTRSGPVLEARRR